MKRRTQYRVVFLLVALAAILAVWTFSSAADGTPSFAHLLFRTALLAWSAGRIEASSPAYLAPPPLYAERGLGRPWRVGIQAGHWHIDELPDEQARLRADTGASYGNVQEVDVNLAIARRVVDELRLAGVTADLLPATVPVGYDADAFVAIHADGGSPGERGFKISAPWRASPASRLLQGALERAYAALSTLPQDRYGVTYNMRGYYGFSWYRFAHAVAPSTPCAIIETGFISSSADRAVIVDDPQTSARAITAGIFLYLSERARLKPDALAALAYAPMIVATDEAPLRFLPENNERIAAVLPLGTVVRPTGVENGWVELIEGGKFRTFGWMKLENLRSAAGG